MRILIANNTHAVRLHEKYPNYLGWLISDYRKQGRPAIPYALDNGAFTSFKNGTEWNQDNFLRLLDKSINWHKPLWVSVPDVVCSPVATLEKWHKWEPVVRKYGYNCAFVAQDGHTVEDIPGSADLVFLGGSTDWKLANLKTFCSIKPVHVGRVNSHGRLWQSFNAGAVSCDGTGWFRGGINSRQANDLRDYLRIVSGEQEKESNRLFFVGAYCKSC